MKKRHHIKLSALLCGAIALSIFLAGEARAQDGMNARGNADSLTAGLGKPTTLMTALERFTEEGKVSKDEALLVVNPAKTISVPQAVSPTNAPEEAADSLGALAHRFNRLVVTSGPVTALVPPQMVLFNPAPGAPNIYQGLEPASKMRLLMEWLTPVQWQQLGSAGGLGAADLSEGQRLLFLSLLPEPFCIRKISVEQGGNHWEDAEARILSPEAREKIRLRLNLASEVHPIPSALGQGITLLGDPAHRQGTSFLTLDDAAKAEQNTEKAKQEAYGVLLRAEVTNAQKPSDLDFNLSALAAPVALKPESASNTGLTVGEIVRRAGAASHLELYADRRIAALPVWTRGTSAPAADLLRALCLSVTGTFRRVGPAFVLTDDVAGIGTRLTALQDWLEEAKAQQEDMLEALQAPPLSKPLLASLSFPSDDPLANDAATTKKVLAGYGKIYSGDYQVPLGALPASRRAVYQNYIDDAQKQEQPIRTDAVALNINLRMAYLVPGEGEVSALQPDLGSLLGFIQPPASELMGAPPEAASPLKPVSLAALTSPILCLSPKTESEAVRSVDAAKAAGFRKLWVNLPSDGNTALLAAAIGRGKKQGVAVSAVVSLFRQPAGLPDADQDVQGKTSAVYDAALLRSAVGQRGQKLPFSVSPGDWEQASAACLDNQKKRLTMLAGIPGLAGIVLRDTAAPGYEASAPPRAGNGFLFSRLAGAASHDMGYTEGLRLTFLRRYGLDPVDAAIPQSPAGSDWSLPFFPSDTQGVRQWAAFRGEINARHMAALFAALRLLNPRLPLLIGERSGATAWFGSWDKPQALPLYDSGVSSAPAFMQARSVSSQIVKSVAVTNENISPWDYSQYAQSLLPSHSMDKRWDGVAFDLSALPIGKAVQLVKDCFREAAPGKL